jgi:hypothetical protein
MKHTPAPWHVTLNDRGTANEIWSRDGWIARLQPRIGDEEDANARLIAAAPELLTALRNLLEDAIALGIEDSDRSGSAIEAKAALAKVEG